MGQKQDQEEMEDDFVLLELAPPTKSMASHTPPPLSNNVEINLQPIGRDSNEVLLSVIPPHQPHSGFRHTSCDIVLVIDVSGSMNAAAELPDQTGNEKKETSGLSILDLVKHAARTILEKLDEDDRLAVVTFSSEAKIIQGLLPMTVAEKTATWKRIEKLTVHDSTNLWSGIREALKIFDDTKHQGNAQGMFVLTDGVPNHMCPSQGYVRKLQPLLQKLREERGDAPAISCFGFGYHLRSALLRSIAEVGRGHYAFIPDAGMIGTVFVHAVANIFSTFATSAEVVLSCPNASVTIDLPCWLEFDTEAQVIDTRVLHLGNIQYGQSRDIIVKLNGASRKDTVTATIHCRLPDQQKQTSTTSCRLFDRPNIPQTVIDYHVSRHDLCTYLASLSTKNHNKEHISIPASSLQPQTHAIDALVELIRSRITSAKSTDPKAATEDLAALLADIQSPDPANPHGSGQITLAVQLDRPVTSPTSPQRHMSGHSPPSTYSYHVQAPSYYQRWGTHYLPSILHAHMRQICTTFKDPGPLRYGNKSPLFAKMRDELDDAFDKLPAPKGSLKKPGHGLCTASVRMSRYNSYNNPCFAGECLVRMSDGVEVCKVEHLRSGDKVWTPKGERTIRGIVVTPVDRVEGAFQELCHISDAGDIYPEDKAGLWVTPYHPFYHSSTSRWVFPKDVATRTKVMEAGAVYSVLLNPDEDVDSHAIEVGGNICVTLGHGLTRPYTGTPATAGSDTHGEHSNSADKTDRASEGDNRAHPFFGSYSKVLLSLSRLSVDKFGRWVSGGVVREGKYPNGGLACDFAVLSRSDQATGKGSNETLRGRSTPYNDNVQVRCRL